LTPNKRFSDIVILFIWRQVERFVMCYFHFLFSTLKNMPSGCLRAFQYQPSIKLKKGKAARTRTISAIGYIYYYALCFNFNYSLKEGNFHTYLQYRINLHSFFHRQLMHVLP